MNYKRCCFFFLFFLVFVYRNTLTFRHPRNSAADGVVFLRPFTLNVWYYLILFGSLAIFLLWLLIIIERNFQVSSSSSTKDLIEIHSSIQLELNYKMDNSYNFMNLSKFFSKKMHKFQQLLLSNGFEWLNEFLESFLFYVGVICQQGNLLLFLFCFFVHFSLKQI